MSASPYPDFYIIGAAKAGTTSLVDMLKGHEAVWFPHEKEPHHFFLRQDGRPWTILDGSKTRPLAETLPYAREQDYISLYSDAPGGVLRGDASTQYLVNETTAQAVYEQRPDAKIVVVLRHPTDRAYSAFLHARSRGEEGKEEFADAIDECEAEKRETSFATNYLGEGEYQRHLAPWRALFADRLHVILFEDLIQSPQAVLDRVTDFLGIDAINLPEQSASHKNASVELKNPVARAFRMAAKRLRRSAPALFELPLFRRPYEFLLVRLGRKPDKIHPDQRSRLDRHYGPHIDALEAAIGRDLSGWRR